MGAGAPELGEGGRQGLRRRRADAWDLHREELGKNINADEAAAMGAVYQAAALSKAFKVKPFVVRDAVIYPILVSEPVRSGGDSSLYSQA